MSRVFLGLSVVLVLLAVPVASGAASPQPMQFPENNTTTPATSTPPVRGDDGSAGNDSAVTTVVARIDEDLRVSAYGYEQDSGVFWVEIENTRDRPSAVTVAGVIDADGKGAGSVPIRSFIIRPGTERVRLQLGADTERAVTITSRKSIEQGRGVYLSKEPEDNPFGAFGGTSGLIAGIGTSVSVSLVSAWFVVWRESDGVEVAG